MNADRRRFLKSSFGLPLLAAAGPAVVPGSRAAEARPTLIRDENAKEGGTDWQLTRVRLDER
ncbi:MAG: hypothetical protein KDM63_09530, partial [Verrucomicrobiae bacterium]|nr:hypothetical protein [Verrucomicrobiae bacterium]